MAKWLIVLVSPSLLRPFIFPSLGGGRSGRWEGAALLSCCAGDSFFSSPFFGSSAWSAPPSTPCPSCWGLGLTGISGIINLRARHQLFHFPTFSHVLSLYTFLRYRPRRTSPPFKGLILGFMEQSSTGTDGMESIMALITYCLGSARAHSI